MCLSTSDCSTRCTYPFSMMSSHAAKLARGSCWLARLLACLYFAMLCCAEMCCCNGICLRCALPDFVPPLGKGSLYLRPLLLGSGPILGLGPAPSYTFTIYAAAVGSYFKVNFAVCSGLYSES
jgi:hypothetical protein